jgi:hypothetical protein
MKNKIKILVVFAVMFFASFVPENNHKLFGDWHCKGGVTIVNDDHVDVKGCNYGTAMTHNPSWHWGVRHWIWLFAGLTFSAWTVIDMFIEADKKDD